MLINLVPATATKMVKTPDMIRIETITARILYRLTNSPEPIATTKPPILDIPKMVLA